MFLDGGAPSNSNRIGFPRHRNSQPGRCHWRRMAHRLAHRARSIASVPVEGLEMACQTLARLPADDCSVRFPGAAYIPAAYPERKRPSTRRRRARRHQEARRRSGGSCGVSPVCASNCSISRGLRSTSAVRPMPSLVSVEPIEARSAGTHEEPRARTARTKRRMSGVLTAARNSSGSVAPAFTKPTHEVCEFSFEFPAASWRSPRVCRWC